MLLESGGAEAAEDAVWEVPRSESLGLLAGVRILVHTTKMQLGGGGGMAPWRNLRAGLYGSDTQQKNGYDF